MKFYQRKTFWLVIIFAYAVIFFRWHAISIHDEGYGRSWYYGDGFSGRNVESAAKFYLDSGFVRNYSLPTYYYTDTIQNNNSVYTHYPPMSEWIGGVFASITGHWEGKYIALLPILLSFLLVIVIYKFLSEILNDDKASFISGSLLILSLYFIGYVDDIHQHLYVELSKWSFVYLWWRYLKFNTSHVYILVLWCLYFIMCMLSFEPYIYIAILTLGFSVVLQKKWLSWQMVVIASAPIIAFGLRLYLNTLHLGSFEAMLADMKGAFINRTGGDSNWSELGHAMTLNDYLFLLPKTRFNRLGHFYILPTITLIYVGFLGLKSIYSKNKELFRLSMVIYVACISWIFVMPQHALIHVFTLKHMAILMGIIIGVGILQYLEILKKHFAEKKYSFLLAHSVFISYSIVYVAINTVYLLYLKFGLAYPNFGKEPYYVIDNFFF